MKLAVVGTSHVAHIKHAYETYPSSFEDAAPFFFALNAPILSKQNYIGWPGSSGAMSCDIPEGKAFLNRLFNEPDRVFDPREYNCIILVDFFFCLDFSYIYRDRDNEKLSVSGVMISDELFLEILKGRLGKSSYGENSAVGSVPENTLIPLLKSIRHAAPDAKIYLTPRPFQPSGNADLLKVAISGKCVVESAGWMQTAAEAILDPIGITYLPPTNRQICPETGLTRDEFSVGLHATQPNRLDEHMNAAYGKIIMDQIAELDMQTFGKAGHG